jgi:hypothetical protein
MSETYTTRKGTRIEFIETVPAWGNIPEIAAGVMGTVVKNTNAQVYDVIFDGDSAQVWTVGAWQVRKTYEPPTDADLLVEATDALRYVRDHQRYTSLDAPALEVVDLLQAEIKEYKRRAAEVLAKMEERK